MSCICSIHLLAQRMLRDFLRQAGHAIGRRQVATLMRRMGIEAVYRKPHLRERHPAHTIYPSLLRDLTISPPNHVWADDIIYIPMARGFSISWRCSTGPVVECWPGGSPIC